LIHRRSDASFPPRNLSERVLFSRSCRVVTFLTPPPPCVAFVFSFAFARSRDAARFESPAARLPCATGFWCTPTKPGFFSSRGRRLLCFTPFLPVALPGESRSPFRSIFPKRGQRILRRRWDVHLLPWGPVAEGEPSSFSIRVLARQLGALENFSFFLLRSLYPPQTSKQDTPVISVNPHLCPLPLGFPADF